MKDLIKSLIKKFKNLNNITKDLINSRLSEIKILTRIDFILALGLTVEETNLLKNYANLNLEEEDIDILFRLNDKLERSYHWVDLVNQKVIPNGRFSKEAINFLSKAEEKEQSRPTTIINVNIDNTKEIIKLKDIIGEEENDKKD